MSDTFNPTEMGIIKSAVAQGMAENMSLADIWACLEHAAGAMAFADAINELASMTDQFSSDYERGRREGYELARKEAMDAGWHIRRYDIVANEAEIAGGKP